MKSTSFWKSPNSCVIRVLGLMTGWQTCNSRRGALSTLLSKLWMEKATSPFSEAQYWCMAAATRHVFARQTLSHLLHRTPTIILMAFTEPLVIFDYLNTAFCKQSALDISFDHSSTLLFDPRCAFPASDRFWPVPSDLNKRGLLNHFSGLKRACWDTQTKFSDIVC